MKFTKLIVFTVLLFLPTLVMAEKTDVIILDNGDKITGEILKLEAGILQYRTDTMGTVNIEWTHILKIISSTSQAIELSDGTRVLGQLQKPDEGENIMVATFEGPVSLQPEDVVSVWPVEATFLDRMDLFVSFGFDFKKATEITNMNAAVDFRVRGDDRLTEASLRTDLTRQSGINDQTRWELDAFHEFLLPNKRFRNFFSKLESNDATGVDLRMSGGGSIGKYMIKTNDTWFTSSAGLQAIQENPLGAPSETNVEAVGSLRYRFFRYGNIDRSFDTTFNIYPSLTQSGRLRSDVRSTFQLELVEDLFWSMEAWATHDNEPLSINAEKTDYGIITSVGWSY